MKSLAVLLVVYLFFAVVVSVIHVCFHVPEAFVMLGILGPLMLIVMSIITPGFIKMLIRLHHTGHASWEEIFSVYSLVPQYFVCQYMFLMIISSGLVLLIIPGIYGAIRFSLWPYCFFRSQ